MDEAVPATRDKWAIIGFAVPTAIATAWGLYIDIVSWLDPAGGGGYQGLAFFFGMAIAIPAILVWMLVGGLIARSAGPPGSAKRFVSGSAVAIAASILILTATCYASYV